MKIAEGQGLRKCVSTKGETPEGAAMKRYYVKSDAGSETVEVENAKQALAALRITPEQIDDGAWAWAEAEDGTEEREYIARENMR